MKVIYDDLEDAFSNHSYEMSYWVDRQTGKVILIADEGIGGEIDYEDEKEAEAVRQIRILIGEIEGDETEEIDEDRFVEVDPPPSDEKRKWMEEFTVSQVENAEVQNKLVKALRGRKLFRKFKDVLIYHSFEQNLWYDFESKKLREHIEKWAAYEKIVIDFAEKAN